MRTKRTNLLVLAFMLIGIIARVYQFGVVPGDVNQDEAYAAYEAYSLLHYGMDSHGYHFPVYLVAWGSGMNALNTYLMIPFIMLFGLKTWVIRLPQLIIACITLYVVYLLIKRILNEKMALCALFLLAVSPWHIFLSRWGLESNLAPGFLVFGLYFFVKGIEKSKYFLLSAVMYGLSLYCYATIWPFVPFILLMQSAYCVYYKRLKFSADIVISAAILAVFALPLLLFLLVNAGVMEEISLSFISIPRLLYLRSNEISLKNIPSNYVNLRDIIFSQTDGLIWNATERYGLFYYCSLPFIFCGGGYCLLKTVERIKRKEFGLEIFLIINFTAGLLLGLTINVNINRVNIIFIPLIVFAAMGIYVVCGKIDMRLLIFAFCAYIALFIGFEKYYFTEYKEEIGAKFSAGLESALEEAMGYDNEICVSSSVSWPKVLYYSKEPVEEFMQTVEYTNFPSAFLNAASFGRFSFQFDASVPNADITYVLDSGTDLESFKNEGFTLHTHGYYTVAVFES